MWIWTTLPLARLLHNATCTLLHTKRTRNAPLRSRLKCRNDGLKLFLTSQVHLSPALTLYEISVVRFWIFVHHKSSFNTFCCFGLSVLNNSESTTNQQAMSAVRCLCGVVCVSVFSSDFRMTLSRRSFGHVSSHVLWEWLCVPFASDFRRHWKSHRKHYIIAFEVSDFPRRYPQWYFVQSWFCFACYAQFRYVKWLWSYIRFFYYHTVST